MLSQQLRHVIQIEQRGAGETGYGEDAPSWTSFAADVRASVEPLSGKEALAAAANQGTHVVRIVTRYIAGVTPQMRVVFGGRNYNIQSVANVGERDRVLELICDVGGSNG